MDAWGILKVFPKYGRVASVAFAPDGKKFLAASGKKALLWNIDDTLPKEFSGHTTTVQSVAFSSGGTKFLTGSDDKTARLWNLNNADDTGEVVCRHNDGIIAVAFSPVDSTIILTASRDFTAKLWSLDGNIEKEYLNIQA